MEGIDDYCRDVEAYLCRKNDGHLVRIAGPSFVRVCGWAEQGVPLNVVYRGIDRYFERYYAKGPRRRPVHIDFCEADVLDAFDEWRRAVGVAPPVPAGEKSRPSSSLPAHLERCIARLTALRPGGRLSVEAEAVVASAVRELDLARAGSANVRGEARISLVVRLAAIDLEILNAMRAALGAAEVAAIERQAHADLAAFRNAMAADAYDRAFAATAARLVRERTGLPDLHYAD